MFFCMLGVILGGRIGYVLFYGLSFWAATIRWYPFKIWDGGMSFHGGLLGVLIALAIFAVRRKRRDRRRLRFRGAAAGHRPRARAASATSSMASSGASPPTCRGAVDRRTAKCATPRSSTRRALEGLCCSSSCGGSPRSRGRAWRPRGCSWSSIRLARITVEFWRVPDEHMARLPARGDWVTMGMLLSLPMLLVGLTLLFMAYRRREPSGNFVGARRPDDR